MQMPVMVRITESDGKEHHMKLPVEIWQRGGTGTFSVNSTSALERVVLDPDKQLPDVDRSNNTWPRPGR